ncbi:nitrate- and nitrite sensing domain-containing protein [Streptomyces sp. MS06]|uniref:nitrate- and nitrite sensing domain-containing protein n=1 Tax=Streptomyces sp. MS06 TaxID=3385974 RepID=UPI00399FFACD
MRFRGKSIRRKIVALLLVPLVSLTAIWAYATVLTGREAGRLFQQSSVVEKVGYPVEDTVRVLQQERRQSLVYLADPRASEALSALRRTRAATDTVVAEIRRNAAGSGLQDAVDEDDAEGLNAVLDALDGLASLRRGVEDRTVTRAQALDLYNRLVDPCYTLLSSLEVVDDAELDKEYRALVSVDRARELLSREDALLGSALVVGSVTRTETRHVSDLVAQRAAVYDLSLPQLPAPERERYERFWRNATTAPLRSAERTVAGTEPGATPRGVSARNWDTAAGTALKELAGLGDRAEGRYQDRARPVARGVILEVVVAGVLGLVALLLSLVVSVRIGRGLVRDLRQLRLEAHEASGVRLPSVMRRLSAGEQVDVETEVPRLEYDRNEIGEVGQALNTLQRAAVEAAVKQAELRSGVSEVFVNLARRSQVLLHKQLTLLDAMERRTEDTEELADLFRLDHLTTRMRRHAEGLVILSGAAPSRQWRRSIQLMDVVRAAVAEVEDYERVEVRRLPRVAVAGPAVADLTHLVAELLENATVFSPPHTAVQVVGERVANGFTLEIHDRGLGMSAEALLDANLRLAETPEFELSDTDRLGLFVVSRLARRQSVRVSLQPSPYGGTTAVVFVPETVLTDDVPDTNGIGFRLDRPTPLRERTPGDSRRTPLSRVPVPQAGLPASLLDGPVELEAPVDLDAFTDFASVVEREEHVGHADHRNDEGDGLFRRPLAGVEDAAPGAADQRPRSFPGGADRKNRRDRKERKRRDDRPDQADADEGHGAPAAVPRRRTPKLVSSHGRPVAEQRSGREELDGRVPDRSAPRSAQEGPAPLPARRGSGAPLRRGTGPEAHHPAGAHVPQDSAGDRSGRSDELPALPRRTRTAPALPDTTGPASADRPAAAEPPAGDAEPRRTAGSGRPPGPAEASGPVDGATATGRDRPARPSGSSPEAAEGGPGALPRRVRQASLAPQLRDGPERRTEERTRSAERDADEVRARMASLQRGWRRGREQNTAGDEPPGGTAPQETTKGDE